MKPSTTPPTKPAIKPIGTPSSSEIDTDTTPASSEARVPQITRDNTSRPISSVPNQCASARRLADRTPTRGHRIVRRDPRREQREHDEREHDDQAHHGGLALKQLAQRAAPRAGGLGAAR